MAEKLNDNSQDVLDVKKYLHDRIRKKRILPELKGNEKHKFLNEWNSMKQVLDLDFTKEKGIADTYPKFTDAVLMDLCLDFAVWGRYNLKDVNINYCQTEDICHPSKIEKGKCYRAVDDFTLPTLNQKTFLQGHTYFACDDGYLDGEQGCKHKIINDYLIHFEEFSGNYTEDDLISIPRWIYTDLLNTFRLIRNTIARKGVEGCLPRIIFKNEIQLRKIYDGKEVTGREYLEAVELQSKLKINKEQDESV